MIRVLIKYVNNNLELLKIKGHAESDKYGHDLVCAGVSALVSAGLNNLDGIKKYDVIYEEGDVEIKLKDISEHDKIVLETVIIGLKSIEESYPKNVKIKLEND